MKIKKILISQPAPADSKSPYLDIAKKYSVKIDFKPLIQVEGVSVNEFRQQRVNIIEHTAILFTSKTGIDHFFRIVGELRINIPDSMKYFCTTENIALYLQKYIVYRKRKVFYGKDNKAQELLIDIINKHSEEKYLITLSEPHNADILDVFTANNIKFSEGIFYRTVSSGVLDTEKFDYDMVVFFSPVGVKTFREKFPSFDQGDFQIGALGQATAQAVVQEGFRLDLTPTPETPSMTAALEQFLKQNNKKS